MQSTIKEDLVFEGIPASPGIEYGAAFVYKQKEVEIPYYDINNLRKKDEIERFYKAIEATKEQLLELQNEIARKLSQEEANIFDAHILVLEDPDIINGTLNNFENRMCNIENCYNQVIKEKLDVLKLIGDEHLREKELDIRDVAKRVLHNLLGYKRLKFGNLLPAPRIIVADEFEPSDAIQLSKEKMISLATRAGSQTSHTVIMAKSIGIPAVVGVKTLPTNIQDGDLILIDGYDGKVILHPSNKTLEYYGKLSEKKRKLEKAFETLPPGPIKTKDGTYIDLWVNLADSYRREEVHTHQAKGVGLFRTEKIFLEKLPSEDSQFEVYKQLVRNYNPLQVTIRTVDIGGDKIPSYMHSLKKEENPSLGERGIRFSLRNKKFFKYQLRAILRASAFGKVRLMYPMVSCAEEVIEANKLLEECKKELIEEDTPFYPDIKVGIMIEIPSAALALDSFLPHCSFFSIGSNDLVQYLIAVDRCNENITHLYSPTNLAVLRTIKNIAEFSTKHSTKVNICGEIASEPIYLPLLLGLGLRSLSVYPRSLPELKYMTSKITIEEAQKLAKQLLENDNPKENLLMLKNFYSKKLNELI